MLSKIAKGIDTFSTKQGEFTSMLIIPLLAVVLFEVLMRYGFNSPTVWAFELTGFLYGMHYMFGISYTDVRKGHVKVDIFTSLASKKGQAMWSILTNLIFFMPVFICMSIFSGKYAWESFQNLEKNSTSWAPAIWPVKVVMALCFLFLLLQGIANLIHDLQVLFAKEEQ
jgi:TRAP-type mannitol/chloroaromatic compound transport system permease small subunit